MALTAAFDDVTHPQIPPDTVIEPREARDARAAEIAAGLAELGTGGTPAFIRGYNAGYDDAFQHAQDGVFAARGYVLSRASEGLDVERLRKLSDAATPGPWKARRGYGPDTFAPKGYKFVQFGRTEKKANGLGTDQLSPEDADLIVEAVNFVRAALSTTPPEAPEPGLDA